MSEPRSVARGLSQTGDPTVLQIVNINFCSPDSSGLLDAQSASFPGSEEDFNTLFVLTNSLARLAAKAACNKKSLSHTASEQNNQQDPKKPSC
jgi:hypothetical protein